MANVCDFCGKGTMVGNNVSHALNRSKRKFKANIKTKKINTENGLKTVKVCTKCIKSGKHI